jgi:hypothetical protein
MNATACPYYGAPAGWTCNGTRGIEREPHKCGVARWKKTASAMNWKLILDNPAVNVFLGTLPLLLTIAWGLFVNERRLTRIEANLDTIRTDISSIKERLTRVETKLEGTKLVMGD